MSCFSSRAGGPVQTFPYLKNAFPDFMSQRVPTLGPLPRQPEICFIAHDGKSIYWAFGPWNSPERILRPIIPDLYRDRKPPITLLSLYTLKKDDDFLIQQRRLRFVLGWETVREDRALWTYVRPSVWNLVCYRRSILTLQAYSRHRADRDVNE